MVTDLNEIDYSPMISYENLLRQEGLKITVPRLKILALLHDKTKYHFSAEELRKNIQEQGEDIALATIYRVLSQFEACGLVKRHYFKNDCSVFELSQKEHHDHLVCIECGRIEEFVDLVIEKHQEHIAERFHFKMLDHRLTIRGICSRCTVQNS